MVAAARQPARPADGRRRVRDVPLRARVRAATPVPHTLGAVFDILPAVLFLHVYLAFPDGRLRRGSSGRSSRPATRGDRPAAGQDGARWLRPGQRARGLDAAAAPRTRRAGAAALVSALCLVGSACSQPGGDARAGRCAGPLALLVDSFVLGLVMIAVLFVSAPSRARPSATIQRATYVVIGSRPIVFLIALLDARLARSAVGDLVVELRADPAPARPARRARARAARPVA